MVEYIRLGSPDDRRNLLQDSPIRGDVWIAFARQPDRALDLLITPFETETAGSVALAIEGGLSRTDRDDPSITFLEGLVGARESVSSWRASEGSEVIQENAGYLDRRDRAVSR